MKMTILYNKIFTLLLLVLVSSEGKANKKDRPLPIEIVLNTDKDEKQSTPKSKHIENKEIELKILSDRRKEDGKIDLIIAATKEVQATEQKIDRYSPAFNSEYDIFNKGRPQSLKADLTLNENWDNSRQDTSFYPIESNDLFPFLMLRHVLQTPQPLFLGHNQFSPLQNLRHFEDNLQREVLPHNQAMRLPHNSPAGVVVSQPIFTRGISPDAIHPQRPLNSLHASNTLQNQPFQQRNQNLQLSYRQQAPLSHNPQLNSYSVIRNSPISVGSLHNQNLQQNSGITNGLHRPSHPYSQPQRLHSPLNEQSHISQSIPAILGPNKQPLSLHNRPAYTLHRNIHGADAPLQRNVYHPPSLSHQTDSVHNVPESINPGVSNYQRNRETQLAHYKPITDENRHTSPYHTPHQLPAYQHNPHSAVPGTTDLHPNKPDHLYRLQDVPSRDQDNTNSLQGGHKHPLKDHNPDHQRNYNSHPAYHHDHHPKLSSSEYENPGPLKNLQEDDRKIPDYRSPGGTRPSYYQDLRQTPLGVNSQRYSSSSEPEHEDHRHYRQSSIGDRPGYREPSYETRLRNTEIDDSNSRSEENFSSTPDRFKYDEEKYDSTPAPIKKKKSRKRKRPQLKENLEDLEGHSSHQYIIKIG